MSDRSDRIERHIFMPMVALLAGEIEMISEQRGTLRWCALAKGSKVAGYGDTVAKAVTETIDADAISQAIEAGVREAFDQLWPSQIEGAIVTGTRAAMDGQKDAS